MSTDPSDLEAPDPTLSTDADHSTYASVDPEPDLPPAGPRVEQTLGHPPEAGPSSAKKASSSSSSSSSSASS